MSDNFFNILNWLKIYDVDHGAKGEQKLNDMRERAAYLTKHTGQEPVSWYEFKQSASKEPPHYLRNILVGAVIGALVGAGIGLLVGAAFAAFTGASVLIAPLLVNVGFSGALAGGAVGGFTDTENKRREAMIGQYENYLNNFEASASRAPAQAVSAVQEKARFAERLATERAAQGNFRA